MKMINTRLEADNEFGKQILSNQELEKTVKRNTRSTYLLGGVSAFALILMASGNVFPQKPLLLDTEVGQIITDYSHAIDERTVAERVLVAGWVYKNLRQRTGFSEIDGETLEEWRGQITRDGAATWASLGDRWKDLQLVKPGFRRNVEVLSVVADRTNKDAFTIEAVEKDSIEGEERSKKAFRVRLTLYFTDPITEGVSKLDSVALHSEESVR